MKHNKHYNQWLVLVLAIVSLQLFACSSGLSEPATQDPDESITLELIEEGLNRMTLSERAFERLDIQTVPVREEQLDGTQRLVIPYSAILYDLNGGTWAYISPEPLTFVREAITVDYIEGDMVVLVDGPSSGTEVVTVGAAELHGADTGVGK